VRRTKGEDWRTAALVVGIAALSLSSPMTDRFDLAAQPSRSQWDGVFTEAQADRAAPLFDERCNVCHGGGLAPELFGQEFNQRWEGRSVGELFELITVTMPHNDPGSMTDQEYVDIIAYVLRGGGFPSGREELPPDADALSSITLNSEVATADTPGALLDHPGPGSVR
jgi:mono/diheme cytochrome c family protein